MNKFGDKTLGGARMHITPVDVVKKKKHQKGTDDSHPVYVHDMKYSGTATCRKHHHPSLSS